MDEPLHVDRPREHVARLTLNRPAKRNALSVALRDAITDALAALADDESVKVVVVAGAGETFCAGFDLGEFQTAADDAEFGRQLWSSADRFHRALLTFPLPLVAAVDGPALGGGFDLATCCDIRVATHAARFAHPEYAFGDVMFAPLHDIVGSAVARELCLTGRVVGAGEALDLRLVSEVVEPAALDAAVAAVTDRIVAAPRDALRRTKAKAIARAGIAHGTTLDL